jgi:hypothetical protein
MGVWNRIARCGIVGGMTTAEPARHALYNRLEEVLGPENAETLMTNLPAAELATKTDVAEVRAEITAVRADLRRLEDRFDRFDDRIDHMQEMMQTQFRSYTFVTIGSLTALTGIFAAVVSILQ